jgi:hypothetical protein
MVAMVAFGLHVQQESMRTLWAVLPSPAILRALVFSGAMLNFVACRPSAKHAQTLFRLVSFVGWTQNVRRILDAHDDPLDLTQSVAKQKEPACHCGGEMLQGLARLSRVDHSLGSQAERLKGSRQEKQLPR